MTRLVLLALLIAGCERELVPDREFVRSHEWIDPCGSRVIVSVDPLVTTCAPAPRSECDEYGAYYVTWRGKKFWLTEARP